MLLSHTLPIASLAPPSARVLEVATMFGIGADPGERVAVVPRVELEPRGGEVVFITGPSGGGKSTLLRCLRDAARAEGLRVLDLDALPEPPDAPLVDCFGDEPLERVLGWLSLAGLNDAFVMLRHPAHLSDGQRARFALARLMAWAETLGSVGDDGRLDPLILADEFAATLDRAAAFGVARNVRRWVTRHGRACFVAATTHDDLLEPLDPDVLVEKGLGEAVRVRRR